MDAMTTAPIPTRTLNDGLELPAIGFGTWPLRGDDAVAAVRSALDVGYRLLDTAVNYENEAEVGRAVRESAVPRAEILVQTKVPGRFHARDLAIRSVEDSLRRMHLDADCARPRPNPSQAAMSNRRGASPATEWLVRPWASPTTPSDCRTKPARPPASHRASTVELHPPPQAELVARHNPSVSGPRRGARWPAWNPRGTVTTR